MISLASTENVIISTESMQYFYLSNFSVLRSKLLLVNMLQVVLLVAWKMGFECITLIH